MCFRKKYITSNKEFYTMIFTGFNTILNYKISEVRNLMLNAATINISKLTAFHTNLEVYLKNISIFISYIELSIWDKNSIFSDNESNNDLLYHFIKFIYGIFKNLFDNNSSIIKVSYNMYDRGSNFWSLFKEHILHMFTYQFEAILHIPNVVFLLERYYPDIAEYIKGFDLEFNTNYLDSYNQSVQKLKTPVFPKNLPDEFLDPILFTPIIDPVILPESQIIIERNVILAHILEHKNDPFTRQTLTIEQLDEYNKTDYSKEKCLAFINKRNNWILECSGGV
jgi:hypothetical protein